MIGTGPMKRKIVVVLFIVLAVALCAVLIAGISKCAADKKKEEEKAALVKAYTENKLAAYAAENAAGRGLEVVFLGDSLTDGCDLKKYYAG